MATLNHLPPMAATNLLFIIAFVLLSLHPTDAQIGVCYGRKGNNLPSPKEVVKMYNYYGIQAMRLYDPDQATLQALQSTWIQLMLGVLNEDIQNLATRQWFANKWVNTNVVPYAFSIKYISVGNEIHPSDPQAPFVLPAMKNILKALRAYYLDKRIKVSTSIDTTLITDSYPPSNARFINLTYITPILNFLATYNSPLLVNIQPYIAYVNDPKNIRLDYALFTAPGTVFTDYNGLQYQNLFDAIYDAVYTAVQKVVTSQTKLNFNNISKGKKVKVVASESGWPSKRGFHPKLEHNTSHLQINEVYTSSIEKYLYYLTKIYKNLFSQIVQVFVDERSKELQLEDEEPATIENAKTYYTNLINHVKYGTPLTRGEPIETYLFAMFDENEKPGDESERHYGLFNPETEQPKYGYLDFCLCRATQISR